MALFNRVTIVGLGLIGGSLGMAIRRKRLAREVVGFSRRLTTIRRARQRGAIDIGTTDPRRAVEHAELVILATPVDAIIPQAKRLARFMRRGSVLTDVGSTKDRIVRALGRGLPPGLAFVGAHPLAGSEQRGIDAAHAGLFSGSVCVITPNAGTPPWALRRVRRLWTRLVGRVITMDSKTHDRLVASVSHLPHLLAFCLMEATNHGALSLAPRSFLEATRVAKSDPDLWDDILLSNRSAVLTAMDRFDREWRVMRTLLVRSKRAQLSRRLAHAKSKRDALRDP